MREPKAVKTREPNLLNICQELLMLILHLRSTDQYGDESFLKSRIQSLLMKFELDAGNQGFHPEQINQVKFALVAFLDETIITSNWSERDRWRSSPFQFLLFQRYDAGEEFFTKLDALKQNLVINRQLLQVYYMCLVLGFKGKYQLHDADKLRILIDELYALLSSSGHQSSSQITPKGYPREEIIDIVAKEIPAWVIAAVAGGLVLLIYVVLNLMINNAADGIAKNIANLI
ncbi:MAG: DotU family type IV/VI secretion system protein [Calditrichaeota bacterium]|nr:MAG: DotU family type IV/VI secretion system protein [Calditrichota bacterium]